jgi:hypothetical protein
MDAYLLDALKSLIDCMLSESRGRSRNQSGLLVMVVVHHSARSAKLAGPELQTQGKIVA